MNFTFFLQIGSSRYNLEGETIVGEEITGAGANTIMRLIPYTKSLKLGVLKKGNPSLINAANRAIHKIPLSSSLKTKASLVVKDQARYESWNALKAIKASVATGR